MQAGLSLNLLFASNKATCMITMQAFMTICMLDNCWISTQIKYKASMDADEVQLSREAQDLNFKKSILLVSGKRRL